MPEGPEVRKHADALHALLAGKPITHFMARTKAARAWLSEHPDALCGKPIESVRSKGKNLVGRIEGGVYFYSHLMMWGRWFTQPGEPPVEIDRRERARIVVPDAYALLLSAPVFEIGEGNPWEQIVYLQRLGPDILPYAEAEPFDTVEFTRRLLLPEHMGRTIGALLLDQTIAAGIGNYLRAEILFKCRLNPWKQASELTPEELACLCRTIPAVAYQSYHNGGVTVTPELQERMRNDTSLVYRPDSEWGTHHYVFRRTNLPCLVCGATIRQQRQMTYHDEDGERTRIIYFCPTCQQTPPEFSGGGKSRKKAVNSSAV